MAYTKTEWNPGTAPGIDDLNLNKIENGISEVDINLLRLQTDFTSFSTTSLTVVSTISNSKTRKMVEVVFFYSGHRSPKYELSGGATPSNINYIYVTKPDSSVTTKYLVEYYFEQAGLNTNLVMKVPTELVGYSCAVNWIYTEG